MNFFELCQVETSDFDIGFANKDPSWNLLNDKYENLTMTRPSSGSIPKIIHFMWIGSPLPYWYEKNIEDWKKKNPKFEIRIWNDASINNFLKDKQSYELFLQTENMGIKSDVTRYEILKAYGGLYLDTDFLCLSEEFDTLHDNYSFYSCCSFERNLNIFNGMIAAIPDHPIIDLCIQNCDPQRAPNVQCKSTRVFYQTGPYLFTRCILHHFANSDATDEVVFPAQVFYPFPAILRKEATEENLEKFIKPWSMACHLWHASWQPNEGNPNAQRFYKWQQV